MLLLSVSLGDIYLLVAVQIGGRITEIGRQVIHLIGLWILFITKSGNERVM